MRNREEIKTSTLKMLMAAIANKEIELKKKDTGLADEEIVRVIKSEAKKRNDAIEAYEKGGRPALADKEKEELSILKIYLPEEISDEKITDLVKEAIVKTGATSVKDLSRVMKEAMAKAQGQADGKRVSQIACKLLSI